MAAGEAVDALHTRRWLRAVNAHRNRHWFGTPLDLLAWKQRVLGRQRCL